MRSLLPALAVLVALCGCSTVATPDTAVDEEQVSVLRTAIIDSNWEATGLPASMRPPAEPVVIVTEEEWTESFVGCMHDAGFDSYHALDGGGWSNDVIALTDERAQAETLANFTCGNRYWQEDALSFIKSEAQLAYEYDYYRDVLIPCMATHGGVVGVAPSREDYIESMGWWHPFTSVEQSQQSGFFSRRATRDECPAAPPGLPSDGYDWMWE